IADRKDGQQGAYNDEHPMIAQQGFHFELSLQGKNESGDRQSNQYAKAQVGESIVVSAYLILRGKQAAPLHSTDTYRIPQGVKVQPEIAVQCVAASGGGAMEQPECPACGQRCGKISNQVESGHGKLPLCDSVFCQQRQGHGVGHGQKIRMDRDGGNIQEKQPRTGHTILPSAIKIIVKRCQDKKLCPKSGVTEGTFQQDRACDKQNIAQKRDKKAAGKQASQQGTERTLQEKAKQGKQSEILESVRQDRGKK